MHTHSFEPSWPIARIREEGVYFYGQAIETYHAARAGREDLLAFYGGQSAPLATLGSAAGLVATLAAETGAALGRFTKEDGHKIEVPLPRT